MKHFKLKEKFKQCFILFAEEYVHMNDAFHVFESSLLLLHKYPSAF